MIDIFSKHYSLTESAFTDIDAYEFNGSFQDASAEFHNLITNESYDMESYLADADEIIAESILSGEHYRADVLIENVFKDVFEMAKKAWENLKKWVKGLIAKFETFMLQLAGQTDKWATKMESRITSANPSDFKYEYHQWNTEMIDKFMNESIKTAHNVGVFGINRDRSISEQLADLNNGSLSEFKKNEKFGETAENFANDDSNLRSRTEKKVIDSYAKVFGINSKLGTAKDFKSVLDKEITGGEKIMQSVDSARMLDFIKGNKNRLSKIKEIYKELKKELEEEFKLLKEIETKVSELGPSDLTNASDNDSATDDQNKATTNFKSGMIAQIKVVTAVCNIQKRFAGDLGNLGAKYSKECAREYMIVLSAYCNASDKQNKKK